MRSLENVDMNFCLYVVKKYILVLGIAVIAAILIGGALIYKNRGSKVFESQNYYTVFSIKPPLSVNQIRQNPTSDAYQLMVDYYNLQTTSALIAAGLLNNSKFTTLCNEKFTQKTGRKLSQNITVTFEPKDALVIGEISSVQEKSNKDTEILANIIADEGVGYLNIFEYIGNAQLIDRASEKNNFNYVLPTAKNVNKVKNKKNSGKSKSLAGVAGAIFIVAAVFGICFIIELRRDPVVSEEDVQNVTGKEVFRNLDKPLAVAAGRNIMQALNGDKIITLAGNLSENKVKQLVSALKMDNIRVSSVYLSNDIVADKNADLLKSQDAENTILLNSKVAADNVDGFYKLLDKLSQESEIVISGIDSTWSVPQLLPPSKSKVIICAVKGKTGNRELTELTTALKLCGIEVIGAIV